MLLLSQALIPIKFWDDAFEIACYIINPPPSSIVQNHSPIELLFHVKPNYSFLEFLDVHVGPIYGPTILQSLNFDLINVSS